MSKPCGSVTVHCRSCRSLAPNIIIRRLVPTNCCFSSIVTVTNTSSAASDDHVGVAQQVDAIGQQIAQRRLRQRIEVLRRELAVAHHDRAAVGDDFDHARRIVFEADLAGLLQVELTFGAGAVGPDLHEVTDQGLDRRQIKADAIDQRALVGVEAARLRARARKIAPRLPVTMPAAARLAGAARLALRRCRRNRDSLGASGGRS